MYRRRAIALLIETSNGYARGLLAGVLNYVRHHDSWSLYLPEQDRGADPPPWLATWAGDGILARIETPTIAAAIRQTGLPAIDLSAGRHWTEIPWVESDDERVAQLAVDHFLERNFRILACCSVPYFNWSRWRAEHFLAQAAEHASSTQLLQMLHRQEVGYDWTTERERLAEWLRQLPKPVGIFACYDILAQQILDVCRDLDLAVPEEVAVLGVDNDELICNACDPPLSSVNLDPEKTGYEAARLLDEWLQGNRPAAEAHLIPPLGVAKRDSTDIIAIADPVVARALRFIREHACAGAKVNDVVAVGDLSRRVLENRFRNATGKTPHDFLVHFRLERAKQLLAETSLTLAAVAERAGFGHAEYLSTVFQKMLGTNPGAWRKKQQRGPKE
ncbi:MAG: DNA-binding transcriptional regulator [Pirellulales bacterium]|nr:DNA-binding transcriptional regulator [Pirellulales bacterium]